MTYLELLDLMMKKLKEKDMNPELAYKIIMLNENFIKSKESLIDSRNNKVAHLDKILETFNLLVEKQIPLSRITREAEFYGYDFIVDDNVFAPRPETELLVEKVVQWIKEKNKKSSNLLKLVDLGTGTGVIAISVMLTLGDKWIKCTGVDKSPLAIANALKNNARLKADVNFENIGMVYYLEQLPEESVNIIVSNPPYIAEGDKNIADSAKNWDPHDALYAPENGLFYYDQILKNAKRVLKTDFLIAFEIGFDQANAINNLIKKYGFDKYNVEIIQDYAHHDRIVLIKG